MSTIAILGTGMASLGAGYRLRAGKVTPVLYDKNSYVNGHTTTHRFPDGFAWDYGPHVSFTKDTRIQELFAASVGGEYNELQYVLNNYWQGHWITHPVQCNLYGLPPEFVTRALMSFIEEQQKPLPKVDNYAEWLVASYGKVIAETFPFQYTAKYHTAPAEKLTTDWMGPRMHRPTLEQVLFGAVSPMPPPDVHYIKGFRYPKRGGFQSYLQGLRTDAQVLLEHRLVKLDPKAKELNFANGTSRNYDAVISSIPLPDLIPMIVGAPREVLEAAALLACSSVVLVNLGVDRVDISKAHISYVYDRDICFSRLNFPHMFSRDNGPEGTGSIQAEVYFSKKYLPEPVGFTPESCIAPVIRDLKKIGLLTDADKIVHQCAIYAEYANIIFDHDRPKAIATVHGYLDEIGVGHAGRYGDWAYLWTDDSFKSGEQAAEMALSRL